jgi:hypothetical protein
MFTHAVILTAIIGVDPIAFTATPIDHVAVERTDDSAYVLGYGVDGEPAIELAVWHVEGEPRLAATLPSGAYVFVSLHDGEATIDALDREAVAGQLAELNEALDVDAMTEQAGWVDCAVSAGTAVGGCIAVAFIGCVGGSILAACSCLPLVVDEFEEYDCPGMG